MSSNTNNKPHEFLYNPMINSKKKENNYVKKINDLVKINLSYSFYYQGRVTKQF